MKDKNRKTDFRQWFRTPEGRIFFAVILGILLCAAMLWSWKCGLTELTWKEFFYTIAGKGDPMKQLILLEIRFPRILLGALTGASLAVSGAILQGVMRNPLADPGIIGVTSGGGLCGLIAMLVFPQFAFLQVPASFLGALSAAVLIYILAWKRETGPVRLVLAGVAVSSMLGAFSGIIMLIYSNQAGQILDFTFGSLAVTSTEECFRVIPYMLAGFLAAGFLAKRLDLLLLGDESAASLGINVERSRFLLILIAALLAASAVSVAGMIGFAGLIAPHIVRMITGTGNRYLLPAAGITGALMVVLCDFAGRMLAEPGEIPAGLLLAMMGPPFFLWLLRRSGYAA